MSMIDTAMLSAMREAIADLLPDTCTILSVTETPDGMGGVTETWGTASANVACRLDVKSGQQPIEGGAMQSFTSYKLSIPYDTTIEFTNRVELDGVQYAVMNVNDGQSWMAVKRVDLELL